MLTTRFGLRPNRKRHIYLTVELYLEPSTSYPIFYLLHSADFYEQSSNGFIVHPFLFYGVSKTQTADFVHFQ